MDARPADDKRSRQLVLAGYLFAFGSAVHVFDHLRRGQGSVTDELLYAGNLALVLQAVVVTLIVTRHPVAPLAAIAAGAPLALGFTAAHWLPEWSALSDPVWEIGSWFSYVASTLEIAGALAIAITGWAVVRTRGLASAVSAPPAESPARA